MSFSNNDQVFHSISQIHLAEIIAYALRKDFGYSGSAVKAIGRKTGLNPRVIRNWYEGRNIPSVRNFLLLVKCSPTLSDYFLKFIDGIDAAKSPEQQRMHSNYGDNFVSINISLPRSILSKLNKRQLWFLGFLQQGISLKAEDIANVWSVNLRTVRRDISILVDLELINFKGARKNGMYVVAKSFP